MNLIELFDSLEVPEGDLGVFNAISIPEHLEFRIAKDCNENAILLLSIPNRIGVKSLKNIRLKYLQLQHNVDCKISENGNSQIQSLTVVTFSSNDNDLLRYFLRISESLIYAVGINPTQDGLIIALERFIEVFKGLSNSPSKSISGLWSELFLIESATNSRVLLEYWHLSPEEKFDFNAGTEKIEVKSSSLFERKHIFSSEQLNPPENSTVLIASIFVKQSTNGMSIGQLVDRISEKIGGDLELIDKMNRVVCKTLGNSIEESLGFKFDYNVAIQSKLFYNAMDVSKIEKNCIPKSVSLVKFQSDLSTSPTFEINHHDGVHELFNAI